MPQTSSSRKPVSAQGKNFNVITQIKLLVPVCILLNKILVRNLKGEAENHWLNVEKEIMNFNLQIELLVPFSIWQITNIS